MTDDWIPCVSPPCPDVEPITIELTIIRCPECGAMPYCDKSIFEHADKYVWSCPEHGAFATYVRLDSGELELGVTE